MRALALAAALAVGGCAGAQIPEDQLRALAADLALQKMAEECSRQEREMIARHKSKEAAMLAVDGIRLGCDAAFLLVKRSLHVD